MLSKFRVESISGACLQDMHNVLAGVDKYRELIPQHFPSVRLRSARGNTTVSEERINMGGQRLLIMAKRVSDPPILHDLFVIGGDIKGSAIRHRLAEVPGGTRITADAHIRAGLLADLARTERYRESYQSILDDLASAACA